MSGENRFGRAMHVRDALRRERLSNHVWTPSQWHGRQVMTCMNCGYIWKDSMARPSQDCRRPDREADDDAKGGTEMMSTPTVSGRRLTPLAEDAQQGGQRDYTNLDE